MAEEGRIDEISVYSVDRISRSIKDLYEIVSFLHEHSVGLFIENMGIRPLVQGAESSAILLYDPPARGFRTPEPLGQPGT